MDSLTRIKIIRLIDTHKKILPLPSPKIHLQILDFLNNKYKFSVLCASRGLAKSTLVSQIYIPTYILETKQDENIHIYSESLVKAKNFFEDTKTILSLLEGAGFNLQIKYWSKAYCEVCNEWGQTIILSPHSVSQDVRGSKQNFIRPTLIICDDIESKSISSKWNAKTRLGREKLEGFFYADLLPSLDEKGRLILLGTILHKDGLIANLLSKEGFTSFIAPIMQDNKSAWESKYPLTKDAAKAKEHALAQQGIYTEIKSIQELRETYANSNVFYQEFLCKSLSDENKLFNARDFAYFDGVEFDNSGEIMDFKDSLGGEKRPIIRAKAVMIDNERVPIEQFQIVSAMDLASDGSDESTIITAGLWRGNIYVLDAIGGHWNPFKKIVNVLSVVKTFSPVKFGIEKANAQNDFFYIAKNASEEYGVHIPIVPLLHGGKKKQLRISWLLPYFRNGRIFFNKKNPRMHEIEGELLEFDIDTESKKDNYADSLAYLLQLYFGIGLKNSSQSSMEFINYYEEYKF